MTPHLRAGVVAAIRPWSPTRPQTLAAQRARHRPSRRGQGDAVFDLELAWNVGISFGWLQSDSPIAQVGLMAVKVVAVIVLAVWMARSRTYLATVALGLIIGGAVGNGIDRFLHGAVIDFAHFHLDMGWNPAQLVVFNLADVAIVAG